MRRMMMIVLLLTALALPARAQLYGYEYENTYYRCTDFAGELPEDAASALTGVLRADDEVICGSRKTKYFVRGDVQDEETSILLAVRRDAKILLVHAGGENGEYTVTIESDSFLENGMAFDITTQPDDEGTFMAHEIIVGDETYTVSRKHYEGNRLWITRYRRTLADGRAFRIRLLDGHVGFDTVQAGHDAQYSYENGLFPNRLAAWTVSGFPKTEEALRRHLAQRALSLADDEAYIIGVNLRERPTGESASWGKYTARVRVLGKELGLQSPWFHVRTGNLTGWASGLYVVFDGTDDGRLYDAAATVHDVGKALCTAALTDTPDGRAIAMLDAGTLVHVLGERDGYLHVIVPRGKLTHETDWNGTYGFVRKDDMAVGISKADVIWR